MQIVGDDLLVTNPKRIREAAEKKACNALLLKVSKPPHKHTLACTFTLACFARALAGRGVGARCSMLPPLYVCPVMYMYAEIYRYGKM